MEDTRKLYHVHGFDSRAHMKTYLSSKPGVFHADYLKFPIERLHKAFIQGNIGGRVLIDASSGSIIHQLLSAVSFFQDIIVLKVSTRCVMELKKWLTNDVAACDWTHASSYVWELQGKSDEEKANEEKLKKAIKQVLLCDPEKENLTDPVVLQPADCLVTFDFLEYISKNLKEYVKNLKKLANLLQPGGRLILQGIINAKYIVVGNDEVHLLKMSADEVRESFLKAGLIIDTWEVQKRDSSEGRQLFDYESVVFVTAHKSK
ncbi:indolethylamine N-methyltransferase-like [Mantella aurantiaca]